LAKVSNYAEYLDILGSEYQTVKQEYLKRVVDEELNIALKYAGAVLIEGPKWCGKTRTAEERAASVLYLQDIRKNKFYAHTLDNSPADLLEGETPRLIDEWQTAPILWNGVRFEVDQRCEPGQFILTGSAVLLDTRGLHTGTGRFARIFMRPMSLFESQESNGSVSLASLFNGDKIKGTSALTIRDLAYVLVRGGWPDSIGKEEKLALRYARDYVDSVINGDISRVDGVERNPERVSRLMRSLARNVSTMANMKTINNDVTGKDNTDIANEKTIASYINALKQIFVIEDLPAWSPDMRSKTALRTSSKRHFVDPSVAAAVLKLSPDGLLKDFNMFGLLFESLCIRDLRIYAQSMEGELHHFHDKNGLEVDAIVSLYDKQWGAFEIKMGGKEEDKAAENLLKLKDKVNTDEMGSPSFLAILTATEDAYLRRDGVYVIPLGCLRN